MSSRSAEDIVNELATLTLRDIGELEPAADRGSDAARRYTQVRDLAIAARAVTGPIQRAALHAETADDYLAVVQIALAIGYDGQLSTSHRQECPKHAVVPLIAALRHLIRSIERDLRATVPLDAHDVDRLTAPILHGMVKQDFDAIRLEIAVDSRTTPDTEQTPKLIIPG
jgi:hypothetical protein